jgi:hypothetical protein
VQDLKGQLEDARVALHAEKSARQSDAVRFVGVEAELREAVRFCCALM